MKKALIVLILLTSCSDNYDSNEPPPEEIVFINNAYKYNCGKSKINLTEDEIIRFNELCQEYEKIFLFNVNRNLWIVDVFFRKENSSDIGHMNKILMFNKYNGLLFRDNLFTYRNDSLAKFILEKLDIKCLNEIEADV
ncbi:hypothetical protein [uncultured Arcticibacterium sp.]|uniref:hypothetical protein n=1 Tax=uncultured Arcticibacterium sp. TaxID=2173042 RepID=UPI0030FC6E0D